MNTTTIAASHTKKSTIRCGITSSHLTKISQRESSSRLVELVGDRVLARLAVEGRVLVAHQQQP